MQQNQELFYLIADTVPAMVWIAGTDTLCYYFNSAWLEFTGRKLEQEQRLGWAEGIHPEDVQQCWDTYLKAFEARQKFQFEYRRRRESGEYCWISDKGVPRFEPDGSFAGYIGSCIDISDHKQKEAALKETEVQLRLDLKAAQIGVNVYRAAQGNVIDLMGISLDTSEHQHIESELWRTKEMLQLVIDNIPQAIFWKDKNSVFLGCNRNFARAAGVGTPENIVGKTDYDLAWNKEEADFFRQCDLQVMEMDTPEYHIIEPQLQADGKQAWLDTNKIPLHDAEGNVVGILGTYEDITERKQAESALRNANDQLEIRVFEHTTELSNALNQLQGEIAERQHVESELRQTLRSASITQEMLQLVMDNIPQLIFWKDRNSVFLGCNRNLVRVVGMSCPEEIVGKTDYDLPCKKEEADFFRECDNRVMETDIPEYHIIEPILQADGKNAWLETNKIPLHDAEGNVVGILVTIEDITVRKQAESALRTANEQLEIKVFERTIELSNAIKQLQSEMAERKQTESALRESEAQFRQQATKLEQALQDLQKTQSQLIQTEKMSSLGQMIAGIAHEINNPIGFIYSNIQPAKEYIQDLLNLMQLYQQQYPRPTAAIQAQIQNIELEFIADDLPKILSSIEIGAERISQLVLSLRNFSRLDEAEVKQVNLHSGIDNTLLILNHRLKLGITVSKQYGNLPLVECYPAQLNQVFMNILNNAIDALQEQDKQTDKQIVIQTQAVAQDHIRVQFWDNGPGILLEIKDKIFDPFFTTKDVGKGTGLGLSICYQIIAKHRGWIEVNSHLGQGTEFTINLPVRM